MPGTRVVCTGRRCDEEKVIPEHRCDLPDTIRTGCESCGLIRQHRKVWVRPVRPRDQVVP